MKLIRNRDQGGSARLTLDRPEYYVQTGSMFENPHGVPPDEIVRYIIENPAELVAQVVFGKYVESSGLVFISDLVQRLFDRKLPIIRSNGWVDERVAQQARIQFEQRGAWNNRWYTGVDLARQEDHTVIFTIDTIRMPAHVVYYRRVNRVPWDSIYAEVGRARHLFGPNILADSTGMGGDVILDALHSSIYCPKHNICVKVGQRCTSDAGAHLDCDPAKYLPLSCVEGYEFGGGTGQRKKRLVEHLRDILAVGYARARLVGSDEFGLLRCPPIPQLEEELSFYSWDDKRLETDCLMALALAVWAGLEEPVRDAIVGSTMGR